MHLYFIDDSGDPSRSTTHFVLGGVVIPGDQWHKLKDSFAYACERFKVHGEIKWRLFGKKPKPEDRENPISHLNFEEKDELRKLLLESLVKFNSVKIIASVVHLPTIYSNHQHLTPENVYSMAYKPLTERFQYYLQVFEHGDEKWYRLIEKSIRRHPLSGKIDG